MNKRTNKAYKKPKEENPIIEYVKTKGFYIALIALTAILTVSVFTTSYMKRSMNARTSFDDEAWKAAVAEKYEKSDGSDVISVENLDEPYISDEYTSNAEIETPSIAADISRYDEPTVEEFAEAELGEEDYDAITVAAEILSDPEFSMPCIGEIAKEYSMDELVYSKTMEDWRTHSGIDIAAGVGTQVKAAADGVVSDVYTDESLGNVVEIEHSGEFKTIYANLQSADYIEKGKEVKSGDIIGGVGSSSGEEGGDEPHLHFEVLKNGEPIKPEF